MSTPGSQAPGDTNPALGQSAHDQAMAAKVDAANTPQSSTPPTLPSDQKPTRPDHIPEKFWDAEKGVVKLDDLAKSYAELEKAKSGQPPKPAEAPLPGNPQAAIDQAAKTAEEAAKAAGGDTSKVDFTELSAEFAQNGSLSADSYSKLAAAGIPQAVVDQFIQGQTAVANAQVAEAYAVAGGQEQYKQMLQWAVATLPKDEQLAFDRAVVADTATRKMAIEALKAKYTAANGEAPQLVGGGAGAAAAGAYQSRAEVTADMRDPRYKADPAFRAQVERKLANSTVF